MKVFDLKMGETGVITRIDLAGGVRERLSSLGIRVGERVEVISFSLLKSSVLISWSAVRVGLRKSIAKKIEVGV